jgi:hypothetical protein
LGMVVILRTVCQAFLALANVLIPL